MTSQTMLFTDMVTPVAAVLFLDVDGHEAQLAELPEVLQERLPVSDLVQFRGYGVQLRLGEVARRILNHFLGFCQFHIHKTLASPPSWIRNIKPSTRGRTPSVDGLLPISGNDGEVKEGFEAEPRPLTSLRFRSISRR